MNYYNFALQLYPGYQLEWVTMVEGDIHCPSSNHSCWFSLYVVAKCLLIPDIFQIWDSCVDPRNNLCVDGVKSFPINININSGNCGFLVVGGKIPTCVPSITPMTPGIPYLFRNRWFWESTNYIISNWFLIWPRVRNLKAVATFISEAMPFFLLIILLRKCSRLIYTKIVSKFWPCLTFI